MENQEKILPTQSSNRVKPIYIALILIIVAVVAVSAFFTTYKSNKVITSSKPTPKSLKIPGYELSTQGIVSEVSSSFLKVKEKGNSFPDHVTNISIDLNTVVFEQDISTPVIQSTTSGVIVSYPSPAKKISYDKLKVEDNVQITLTEKDSKLFAKEITVIKTQVSSR